MYYRRRVQDPSYCSWAHLGEEGWRFYRRNKGWDTPSKSFSNSTKMYLPSHPKLMKLEGIPLLQLK